MLWCFSPGSHLGLQPQGRGSMFTLPHYEENSDMITMENSPGGMRVDSVKKGCFELHALTLLHLNWTQLPQLLEEL